MGNKGGTLTVVAVAGVAIAAGALYLTQQKQSKTSALVASLRLELVTSSKVAINDDVVLRVKALDSNGGGVAGVTPDLLESTATLSESKAANWPATDTAGTADLTIGIQAAGQYSLIARTQGATGMVKSNPVGVSVVAPQLQYINLSLVSPLLGVGGPGTTFNFSGQTVSGGAPVPNVKVNITQNGTTVKSVTSDGGGNFQFSLSPSSGDYAIAAVAGSVSSSTLNIHVTTPSPQASPTISISPSTVSTTSTIQINIGGCSPGGFVQFFFNNVSFGGGFCDSSGRYSQSLALSPGVTPPGTYSVTVTDTASGKTSTAATLTVTATTTTVNSISLTAGSTNIVTGQSDTFIATYVDGASRPISNAMLYLFQLGIASSIGSAPTDANGNARFPVTFADPGTYTLDVSDNASNS